MALKDPDANLTASASAAGPTAAAAGRGAALRDSMRQLLQKKACNRDMAATSTAVASTATPADSSGYPVPRTSMAEAAVAPEPASSSALAEPKAVRSRAGPDKDRGAALREALKEAPRGEALRASMRQLLASKKDASAKLTEAAQDGTTNGSSEHSVSKAMPVQAAVQDEDPWPELPLSMTSVGVEDGRRRAEELTRRGDFGSAARMWAKVVWVARNCRKPLGASDIAALEAELSAAAALVPAPPEPPEAVAPSQAVVSAAPANGRSARAAGASHCAFPPSNDINGSGPNAAPAAPANGRSAGAAAAPSCAPAPPASSDINGSSTSVAPSCLDGAAAWNQAFFSKMEKDYEDLCAHDGWDAIIGRNDGLKKCEMPKEPPPQDDIPADSDYFRVQIPTVSRELRPDPAATLPQPKEASQQMRNLDELRRVEAATREAMEREKARYAARSSKSGDSSSTRTTDAVLPSMASDSDEEDGKASEPIRTKSDTVRIDTLSDSEDELEDRRQSDEKVRATFEAFQEYERLAREKEERLARWRKRYGAD